MSNGPSDAPAPGDLASGEPVARPSARLLAFYLPQFHPIPENDEWWGKGFTEWTNTAKAKPLFRGHYQPHVPADLGFYDLRVPETRLAQAEMARNFGLEAFCYYHYWFAGKRILERPFQEVLSSGAPDFPFCLCWANQTWTGIWHGAPGRILMEQTYPGDDDHRAHFDTLLPAFMDPRHVTVHGKPVFVIFRPNLIPDAPRVMDLWRTLAVRAGLKGLHLVGVTERHPRDWGLDKTTIQPVPIPRPWVPRSRPITWLRRKYHENAGLPTIYRSREILDTLSPQRDDTYGRYPMVLHAWDNSPRSGRNGIVLRDSTPELFRTLLRRAFEVHHDSAPEDRIVFLKSWNEWAEGNHLEPDLRFGHAYLEVIREELAAWQPAHPDTEKTGNARALLPAVGD